MTRLSLRYQLLRRLLPAMLLLLVAGAGAAYWVALRSATLAYDRALLDTALAIGGLINDTDGKPVLQLTPQARKVLLTDRFDRIYFAVRDPDGELLAGEAALPFPAAEERELNREGRLYYDGILAGRPLRLAALQSERGGRRLTVVAAETMVKREALLREILLGILLPELVLAVVTLFVVWFGIRSGLSPLAELRRQLANRSHTDLSPVTTDVPDEIQPVVDEINDLLGRLERSLASQRHFVSDAAHQLRTPIAALQTQVELALRCAPASAGPQLQRVLRAGLRLAHLVEQLLVLARAEPTLLEPLPTVDLAALIRDAAENWLPQAIERGVDLGFDLGSAPVRGNPLLLQEMLTNLIDNALRHSPPGGAVNVACGATEHDAWLSVEDSGAGIAQEEREKVFERFYQAPGGGGEGCGLGLAIVRQIARQHGGDAVAGSSSALGGAALQVRLPAASGG